MRRIILNVLFLLLCIELFSQIKTHSDYIIKKVDINIPYDSTINYVRDKYSQYIGQTLYYPKSTYKLKNGIEGFNTTPKTGSTYKKKSSNKTKHEFIEGKYFLVTDTAKNKYGTIFLKLKELESGDIIYYHYKPDLSFDSSFPFFVKGYFEKQKTFFIGRSFPLLPSSLITYKYIGTDEFVNGSSPINGNRNYMEWSCIDYFIEEGVSPNEMVILEDEAGKRISMSVPKLLEESEFALKANFRIVKEISRLKAINNLEFGMSKFECELLCGKPKKKNITSNSFGNNEQWVYDDSYLYFEDDKLVSIQKSE